MKSPDTKKTKRAVNGRSLSEAQSEDFSSKLNKRFDKAAEIEETESAISHDSLVDRPKLLSNSRQTNYQSPESSSGINFDYPKTQGKTFHNIL